MAARKPRLTVREVAVEIGVCKQRIDHKIKQGHFPNAGRCECGRTVMIPRADIDRDLKYRGRKPAKDGT